VGIKSRLSELVVLTAEGGSKRGTVREKKDFLKKKKKKRGKGETGQKHGGVIYTIWGSKGFNQGHGGSGSFSVSCLKREKSTKRPHV